ncbi:MAG: hydrogenase formation protein HypD [Candidatus Omnitrophota bacterium]|nr:hydrogenase formation protein HypD [Candidatus Omnitrophota bacterium]
MKYIDEFRSKNLIQAVAKKIKEIASKAKINIMEVCGTHTQSFYRFGLDRLLPQNLNLIAGPGCPVCVSSQVYIDQAIELAKDKENIILTFGDMLRVPGEKSTLEKERAKGGQIQVVYSALDSLNVARLNPDKKVIFLAVGFETTAPTIALSIITAKKEKFKNLFFLSSLKLIPPAMDFLVRDKRLNLNGFLCPGHVSAIIGARPYEFIPRKYKIGCCVAGFEPLDILEGIYILVKQIVECKPKVENQYLRVVTKQGNLRAQKKIKQVFNIADAPWRGLGKIPQSGLNIRDEYSVFDAEKMFCIRHKAQGRRQEAKCKCGDVLKGLISPLACPLFSRVCQPDNPVGPCMVSSEGACNAYYKYKS